MPQERDVGAGLIATVDEATLDFVFPGARSGLRFVRLGHLVQCSLRFGACLTNVDVSFQPGAVVREIDVSAREAAVDPNRWRLAVLASLREWTQRLAWCPQDSSALLGAVGALAHPLLATVYERNHAAIGEVPRWAVRILRAETAPTAAHVLAGEGANRRLARSLATSLVSRPVPAAVELGPLALAVMGAGLVTVDELANILEVPVAAQPTRAPTNDQVCAVRRGLEYFAPHRRAALLIDVARHHDARALATTMTHLCWIGDRVEHPLPIKLGDLQDVCRRLVPVLTPPPIHTPPVEARQMAPADVAVRRAPVRAVTAPASPVAVANDAMPAARRPARPRAMRPLPPPTGATILADRWPIQPELREIHHYQRDDLRFVVPTSVAELRGWGSTLRNCIGDFGAAVASSASWLIGVEVDGQLVGCAEIQPQNRRIRQALGPRNAQLPGYINDALLAALRECGVIPTAARR